MKTDRVGTHRKQRCFGRHTTISGHNGKIIVTYHATPVVVFDDNTINLCTGGWATVTTKRRMNQASNQFDLGYRVYQKNYDWYVAYKGQVIPFNTFNLTLNR